MKYKGDFVTNSSSSSFIVVFPKEVKVLADVEKFMENWKAIIVLGEALTQTPVQIKLGKDEKVLRVPIFDKIYAVLLKHFDEYYVNTAKIVSEITDEIEKECPGLMVPMTTVDYIISKVKRMRDEFDPYESLDVSDDEIKKLIKESGNKGFVYYFHYSDNEGDLQTELEHGGTFDKLPHIQISHH